MKINQIEAFDDAEIKEYLYNEVKPFIDKGYKLVYLSDEVDRQSGIGHWLFTFDDNNNKMTDADFKELEAHAERDDYSQPHGLIRIYFGTIWYLRPYIA